MQWRIFSWYVSYMFTFWCIARHKVIFECNSTINYTFSFLFYSSNCNTENMSTCCQAGHIYDPYKCSPSSTSSAILTLNDFGEGGDGGSRGACTGAFYDSSQPVVAISTGWFNGGSRCGKTIIINGNGKTTTAVVVDECYSVNGCDATHAGQPPCRNNIVDASAAVWEALGVSSDDPQYGEMAISWSDK